MISGEYRAKLTFYVPKSHLEAVKSAIFLAGAGQQGDYDQCCWQTLGEGQFRPLSGSQPFIGQQGSLSRVPEYKVEVLCASSCLQAVVAALRAAHPYQEPAYDCYALLEV